jgi:hypothetical protein
LEGQFTQQDQEQMMMKIRILMTLAASITLVALGGCGPRVSGTYTDKASGNQWTFKSGTVTVSNGGMSESGYKYKVEGKKILLTNPNGNGPTLELDINDKGCITGVGIMVEACK